MSQYIFTMLGVSKTVPPKNQILKNISLSFLPGAKIGVLGLNGSGKSSLLKIMAGVDKDYDGEARCSSETTIGYLEQEPYLDENMTVKEIVEEGLGDISLAKKKLDDIYKSYAEPDADFEKLSQDQAKYESILASKGSDLHNKLEVASDALRLPAWEKKVSILSGGEKRRVALCRLLISNPDMLLLDEPTNHLDAESVNWLELFLHHYKGTVVAVTHDRYFLDNVAEWILELDRGQGIPWKGNYTSWLFQKEKRLMLEEKQETRRIKTINNEIEWIRSNPKARQAKSKSRLSRFEQISSLDYQSRNETQEIFIPVADRLGNEVIEISNLTKIYNEKILFENLNLIIPPGAIVGVIGPNGAGKSTLFKMISDNLEPDSGEVKIGKTVKISSVDQSRDLNGEEKSVWSFISNESDILKVGSFELQSRAYVSRFNFRGQDQQKLVKNLSGGERGRLHLAKTLLSGGNVLLLDEPSNDLDVETLRALENAILDFAGTILVISHDRWFLDRISTHILAFEGQSEVVYFQGNYKEYMEDKLKRLGEVNINPKRIRYRALR